VGLALTGTAVALAGVRTVPAARRLGARRDPPVVQSRVARAVARDHLVCLVLIATVLAIQLAFAA
jgi:hypothetical protein